MPTVGPRRAPYICGMRTSRRIEGLDLARALAVFGMVAVNLPLSLGGDDAGVAGGLQQLFSGRAAAVFVVLAGVGISLMAGGDRVVEGVGRFRWTLARRSLVLAVLGLGWMPLWGPDILHFYAVYLLLGACLLPVRSGWLLAAAATAMLAFPLLLLVLDYEAGWDFTTLTYVDAFRPAGFFRHLLFNGFHPVFPWVAFLFAGMWLGRQDLRSPRSRWRLTAAFTATWLVVEAIGAALEQALLGQPGMDPQLAHALAGVSPLPPLPPYILGSGSLAVVVILLSIPVAERLHRLTAPLQAVGQHALTHYVAHVLLLIVPLVTLQEHVGKLSPAFVAGSLGVYVVASTVFSVLWRRHFRRGPLEALMQTVSGSPVAGGSTSTGSVE